MGAYLYTTEGRQSVPTLAPYLRLPLELGLIMDKRLMQPRDVKNCRWIGYGLGKGVTETRTEMSVFGIPRSLKRGLHADLVAGLPNIDPFPLCYENVDHVYGFGGFVRWVYFASAKGRDSGFFGVDWSIVCRPSGGVATSMLTAAAVIRTASAHGIPENAEVALLNPSMCEEQEIAIWRRALHLVTVADWNRRARTYLTKGGGYCPRCGLKTVTHDERFCSRCGCQPNLIWRECQHGLEA